jgi:hypothetical protein
VAAASDGFVSADAVLRRERPGDWDVDGATAAVSTGQRPEAYRRFARTQGPLVLRGELVWCGEEQRN